MERLLQTTPVVDGDSAGAPDRSTPADEPAWKAAWRQAAGMWKGRDDLPELMAQLRREWNRVDPSNGPLE